LTNNITNATTPTYLGEAIAHYILYEDETGVSSITWSTNVTGSWVNTTTLAGGGGNYSDTLTIPKSPGDKVVGLKWFANDSSNNNVSTEINYIYVTDKIPSYSGVSLNKTAAYIYDIHTFIFKVGVLGDDGNLTSSFHGFIPQITFPNGSAYNSTQTSTTFSTTTAYTNITNYKATYENVNFSQSGEYSLKLFFNDTNNQWNVTAPQNISVSWGVPNITAADYVWNQANPFIETPFANDLTTASIGTLEISYNVSSYAAKITLTNSPDDGFYLYYKTNNSANDITRYFGGVSYGGWQTSTGYQFDATDPLNQNGLYVDVNWTLDEHHYLPGTYEVDPDVMETTAKTSLTLNKGDYASITLMNVSNTTEYNFFEAMVNASDPAGRRNLQVYYCNSSWTAEMIKPQKSNNCTNFATLKKGTTTFNHTHSGFSEHQLFPMAVSGGSVGDVTITSNSSFVMRSRGNGVNSWTIWGFDVPAKWDAHLHQFDSSTTFYYYMNVTDEYGNWSSTAVAFDYFNQSDLGPTAPELKTPIAKWFLGTGTMNVSWADSQFFGASVLDQYNLTLYNSSGSFNRNITNTTSTNITYNLVNVSEGNWTLWVTTFDNSSQSAFAITESFGVDRTNPVESTATPAGSEVTTGNFEHYQIWTEISPMSVCLFATNMSGEWQNVTGVASGFSCYISIPNNDTTQKVGYFWMANDSVNLFATSTNYSFDITEPAEGEDGGGGGGGSLPEEETIEEGEVEDATDATEVEGVPIIEILPNEQVLLANGTIVDAPTQTGGVTGLKFCVWGRCFPTLNTTMIVFLTLMVIIGGLMIVNKVFSKS